MKMARRRPITYRHRSYAGCLRIVPRLEDLEKVAQNYEDLKVQNWRRWKWFFWLYTVFFPVVLLGASISAYARDYLREFFPSVGFACCWVIPSYLYHRYLESKCNKDREVVELLEEEQRQNEESEARRRIV